MRTLPPLRELKRLQAEATPGPWTHAAKAETWDDEETTIEVMAGTDPDTSRISIADVSSLHWDSVPDTEMTANADLIALAPVLLAEVIRMKEAVSNASAECCKNACTYHADMSDEANAREIGKWQDMRNELLEILEGAE